MTLNFNWLPQKPWSTLVAVDIDYYALFQSLKLQRDTCYLFESLEMPRHQDRYYSMGFNPAIVFVGRGQSLLLQGDPTVMARLTSRHQSEVCFESVNPYHLLRDSVGHKFDRIATGHQGGLVGYFSHEAVNCLEPCLQLPEHSDFALFRLGLYLDGLLFDSTTAELTYYSYEFEDVRERKLNEIRQAITLFQSQGNQPKPKVEHVTFIGMSETRDEFLGSVRRTIDKIAKGYSFQAEVGFKSNYAIKGDKFAVYHKLREVNPSPYMFYLKFANDGHPLELMGSSPEILLSQSDGMLLTTPTAGTIHRGKTVEEDAQLGRRLLQDPKEIAEHNMLVDLHRNDLARVAVPGTVKVSDLMYLIKFSHVQHIVSNVVAMKRSDCNGFDTLASLFPGGVVTGAPKIETIRIIHENEMVPRGPYGGAVGRFSFNGDAVFCLSIRSLFCAGDQCFAQTCAGIVYDSVPEKEYDELCNKLAAMKQVLLELGES